MSDVYHIFQLFICWRVKTSKRRLGNIVSKTVQLIVCRCPVISELDPLYNDHFMLVIVITLAPLPHYDFQK